jgi:cytochrome b
MKQGPAGPAPIVFDRPLRVWHWAFGLTLIVSLATGFVGDIAVMDVHLKAGYAALVLALFRLGWAIWGGRNARLGSYRIDLDALRAHLRGRPPPDRAHTPFGGLLALSLWCAVALQTATGLFASDEIATEQGMHLATWIHTRLCWAIALLVSGHLLAIGIYAARRDPLVASMWTGRKLGVPEEPRALILRAGLTFAGAAAAVVTLLSL